MTAEEYAKALTKLPKHYKKLGWYDVRFTQYKNNLIACTAIYVPIVYVNGSWEEIKVITAKEK